MRRCDVTLEIDLDSFAAAWSDGGFPMAGGTRGRVHTGRPLTAGPLQQ
jgi:hypothetical protein